MLLLALAIPAAAEVVRVPRDYPTIQAGLNAIGVWDTVRIDTGVYAEALVAPPFSFVMIGTVDSSGAQTAYTIIDPSSHADPAGRACLWVSVDTAFVEQMRFRNGAAMYPHNPEMSGGIQFDGSRLELRYCRFDSTYRSVRATGGGTVQVDNCIFAHSVSAAMLCFSVSVFARDCIFSSGMLDWGAVYTTQASRVERCVFRGNTGTGPDITMFGENHELRDCLIDPADGVRGRSILISAGNAVIEGNVFYQTNRIGIALGITYECPAQIEVRDNAFIGEGTPGGPFLGQCMALSSLHEDSGCGNGTLVDVRENVFVDGYTTGTGAVTLSGSGVRVGHNRFERMHRADAPCIRLSRGIVTLGENVFANNGLAISVDSDLGGEATAILNWWGDSTGPYHPTLNPDGLGDEVSDRVSFEPWHTDTLFFHESADERHLPLPQKAQLEVFPNPFNATAHLRLFLQQPKIVRIELYDLLGRRARELFVGPVAYVKEIRVDASGLSTGIYFARATDTIERNTLATEKLLLLK